MADARTDRTDAAIKAAFLDLLSDKPFNEITMADLAKQAGISRSTLYGHYSNTTDIFEELTEDFFKNVRGLQTQIRCSSCGSENVGGPDSKRPFCLALRAAGPYQPLVLAPEFLPAYLRRMLDGAYADEALEPYRATGVTEAQARALFVFQITGCYTAAINGGDVSWAENQRAIDCFIRGGFAALRGL